jgi:hypothetical protein
MGNEKAARLLHLSLCKASRTAQDADKTKKPTGSVYHLSHGQREPIGIRSLSLPEQNERDKRNWRANRTNSCRTIRTIVLCHLITASCALPSIAM